MDSLEKETKEDLFFVDGNKFCLNPNSGTCTAMLSSNLQTVIVPALKDNQDIKISDESGFEISQQNICKKCIWARKSVQ